MLKLNLTLCEAIILSVVSPSVDALTSGYISRCMAKVGVLNTSPDVFIAAFKQEGYIEDAPPDILLGNKRYHITQKGRNTIMKIQTASAQLKNIVVL